MRMSESIAHPVNSAAATKRVCGSRRRQVLYAGLLILGIVIPFSRFAPWLVEHGVDLPRFLDELFINRISSFFGWDVLVTVAVLFALASTDRELTRGQRWCVALGALGGASAGLPLYLFLREGNRCRATN